MDLPHPQPQGRRVAKARLPYSIPVPDDHHCPSSLRPTGIIRIAALLSTSPLPGPQRSRFEDAANSIFNDAITNRVESGAGVPATQKSGRKNELLSIVPEVRFPSMVRHHLGMIP